MEFKPAEAQDRLRERVERRVDLDSISYHDPCQADITNQNDNYNVINGSGSIINNNRITQIFNYGEVTNQSGDILIKFLTILEAQHVPQAVYGAQIEKGCMEGTRVQIIRDIDGWIKDPKAPHIFWLTGMAGTGKSAIAWTVCSRSSYDSDIIFGVPTLALLLARQSPTFKHALAAELALDPDVLHQQVEIQVEKLLYKPLLALKDSMIPILFVIDALDECGGQLKADGTLDDAETRRVVSDMLEALVAFSRATVKVPVKFLVTSRPETHIRDTHVSDVAFSKILRLHTADKQQVAADIRLYITNRLFSTAALRRAFTDVDIDRLVQFSDGLFIVAATALQHALGAGTDLTAARFRSILEVTRDRIPVGATAPLDRMYGVVLEDAAKAEGTEADVFFRLQQVFAVLLAARQTLSVAALAGLMSETPEQMRGMIAHVHAVIHVPSHDEDASLRPLHASFGDYLLGRAPNRFRIPESLGHEVLAHGCLKVMEKNLHFNISQSRSSFEQNLLTKPTSITLGLAYACLQWTYHVSRLLATQQVAIVSLSTILRSRFRSLVNREPISTLQSEFDAKIASVFRPRLLFWLEVMSCLGQVQRAAAMLVFAAATVKEKELKRFLRDANSFVASSREAIERSAPHIYISALPFADKDSLLYQDFSPFCRGLVNVDLIGIPHHAGRLVMTLTGHVGAVLSIAYCLDGSLLTSGSADGSVRIWDMQTGEETMTPLCSGDGAVLSVAFSPNTEYVASGTEAGIVCVWPLLAALASSQKLRAHSAAVSSVQFSPDGSLLASASSDKTVRLWNTSTHQQVAVLRGHNSAINAICFAPDGLSLVSGSEDRTIQLWNVATGKSMYSSPHRHEEQIFSVCFMPDGQSIAAGCGNSIIFCTLQTGKKSKTVYTGPSPVRSVRSSLDGQSLVSAHENNVCLSSVPQLVPRSSSSVILGGHTESILAATFAPDCVYVASASEDRTIRVWNAAGRSEPLPGAENSGKADTATVSALIQSDARVLTGHARDVFSVAISYDCSFMASGSRDESVRVWDLQTGNLTLPPLLGHTRSISSVAISSDGLTIASASRDHNVRVWDAQTGIQIEGPTRSSATTVLSVAFSSDARWLASGSFDKSIRIWDVVEHQSSAIGPLTCSNTVYVVRFSPDNRLVAAGDFDGLVHLWDRATGRSTREPIQSKAVKVLALGFSPDGQYVASAGQMIGSGSPIQIWIIRSGRCALTLTGHTNSVASLEYCTDGRFIVSGSYDHTVRLWDVATGAPIAILNGHSGKVHAVSCATTGRFIVSAAGDKTIRIWNLISDARENIGDDEDLLAVLDPTKLENGWLTGPSGELLLWIPTDYHKYFPKRRFPTPGLAITVGSSGWHRAESWILCWRDINADSTVHIM